MRWEFISAETPPDVRRGGMECYIILCVGERSGQPYTQPAYYLNEHPLEYEDCICAAEHDDGCPTTGWFSDEANFDYEHAYIRIRDEVVAYAHIPNGETAMGLLKGPW